MQTSGATGKGYGCWVKRGARDASCLEPLGMFIIISIHFFSYTNESFKNTIPTNGGFDEDKLGLEMRCISSP
jgi:hypothetical protein